MPQIDSQSNEQTPLLYASANAQTRAVDDRPPVKQSSRKPSPLPKLQIAIALLLQTCEPITSSSIYPYVNQLVSELNVTGGDPRKTGYYAGLIESIFFVAEALTVFHWSRLSDRIGRKPVLLIGVCGTMVSTIWFGLSRTYWMLLLSRSLVGMLNGNIGVTKSMLGDLTDQSNRAEGFALLPIAWCIGSTLGPLLGGTLARPHERFPHVFDTPLWRAFPYLLPCLVTSGCVLLIFIIALLFLKETVKKLDEKSFDLIESNDFTLQKTHPQPNSHTPLRQLLTYPVLISVSNYASLAFLNIALSALFPLFLAMPIEIGGLGFQPAKIGYIMGVYGLTTGVFQYMLFAKMVRTFGERRVFVNGMLAFIPVFIILPIISFIAKVTGGVNGYVWFGVGAVICLEIIMDTAYGAVFIFITSSAPNKQTLGATNGLSQTMVSLSRAVGPALSTSLFSLSVEENWLGGYGVYALLEIFALLAVVLALRLPRKTWDSTDDDE